MENFQSLLQLYQLVFFSKRFKKKVNIDLISTNDSDKYFGLKNGTFIFAFKPIFLFILLSVAKNISLINFDFFK